MEQKTTERLVWEVKELTGQLHKRLGADKMAHIIFEAERDKVERELSGLKTVRDALKEEVEFLKSRRTEEVNQTVRSLEEVKTQAHKKLAEAERIREEAQKDLEKSKIKRLAGV